MIFKSLCGANKMTISATHIKNLLFKHKFRVSEQNIKMALGKSMDLKSFFKLILPDDNHFRETLLIKLKETTQCQRLTKEVEYTVAKLLMTEIDFASQLNELH